MQTETIAAISTAMGNSGISIIRVSGDEALTIADRIFNAKNCTTLSQADSHTIHYGTICENDVVIDEVMVAVMRGPRSYTTEDTVEIDCHGGMLVTKKVLEAVIRAGARPAEPGEFTKRAFLNGRIDLSKAEAVMDVINAQNDYALKSSVSQLKGSVSKMISELRQEIIYQIAFIEAVLDDPEHLSFDNYSEKLENKLKGLLQQTNTILSSFENGRMLKEGIKTCILGKPNAGKSSLLNALVGEERAIVTDIAGTTRDVLEETITIGGITLIIMDTAGIRKTGDQVEKIGIDRAKASAKDADLIFYVADGSKPLDESDEEILTLMNGKKAIVLLNKIDLDCVISIGDIQKICDAPVFEISAKKEIGLNALEKQLKDMFFQGELHFNDQVYITNVRQKTAIENGKRALELVIDSVQAQMPEDFYTIDLMNAYEEFGKVIGESVEEDLVNEIFTKFCMGK